MSYELADHLIEQTIAQIERGSLQPRTRLVFGKAAPRWEFFRQTDEKKLEAIKSFVKDDKANLDFYRDALYNDSVVETIHEAMLRNDYCELGAVVRGIFMAELGCAIQEQADKEQE